MFKPAGHGPGQLAPGDPAIAGRLDFQPQPFYDSGPKSTTTPLKISCMKSTKTKIILYVKIQN